MSPRAAFECSLCFEDLPVHEGITLDCDHRFCYNCAGAHAATKIACESRGDARAARRGAWTTRVRGVLEFGEKISFEPSS